MSDSRRPLPQSSCVSVFRRRLLWLSGRSPLRLSRFVAFCLGLCLSPVAPFHSGLGWSSTVKLCCMLLSCSPCAWTFCFCPCLSYSVASGKDTIRGCVWSMVVPLMSSLMWACQIMETDVKFCPWGPSFRVFIVPAASFRFFPHLWGLPFPPCSVPLLLSAVFLLMSILSGRGGTPLQFSCEFSCWLAMQRQYS